MMAFRICFYLTCLAVLFSCEQKNEKIVQTADVVNRRLFLIEGVEKIIPDNSFMYYGWGGYPFFRVTLKNTSNFDLNFHHEKRRPRMLVSYVAFMFFYNNDTSNYLDIGERFIEEDTSFVIKKNEEFTFRVPCWNMRESDYRAYEYVCVNFQLMISTSNDLSSYFSPNTLKRFDRPKEKGIMAYYYPLEFTYWIPNRMFFEYHLLDR